MKKNALKFLLILICMLMLYPIQSIAQESMSKKEKKEAEKRESRQELERLYKIVESKKFVVEAVQVFGNSGDTYPVQSNTNFFLLDSSTTTIQLSFEGMVGVNNVGGITIDGYLEKFDLQELKDGKPIILFGSINSRIGGNSQFTMYVYSSGNARVTVQENQGRSVTFQGRFLNLAESKIYKGVRTN